MSEKFIVFGAPDIRASEVDEVTACLTSGWLGTGPKVAQFESDFGAYKGVGKDFVAAVNSCTAALHVSMVAAGIGPGDEVITTAMTFCATVNAIIHAGGTPVLADIDPNTLNIDPVDLERRVTPRTRAIVLVHFAGRPCDMKSIMAIAERHNLKVIEDCAHAIETEYGGRKAGTFGDFGCFSFYVTKNLATGEGGMVVGRDGSDVARIRMLALHGMSKDAWHRFSDSGYKHYQVLECGFKYNMMDIQAAIGIHQLERIETNWLRRSAIWKTYQQEFRDLPVTRPAEQDEGTRHAYHLYTLRIDSEKAGISRDGFLDEMTKLRVGTGVHYLCIAEHPYYQERYGWRPEDFPHATSFGRQTISLPISPKLSEDDVERVHAAVKRVISENV